MKTCGFPYCATCATYDNVGDMSTHHAEQEAWIPGTASLGARLALIRQSQGWNIKEAALACGIPPASWTGWELHGMEPRKFAEAAGKISARTGVDDYWIMTGKEPGAGGVRPRKISGGPLEGAAAKKSFLGESNSGPFHYKRNESVVIPFPSRHGLAEESADGGTLDAQIIAFPTQGQAA